MTTIVGSNVVGGRTGAPSFRPCRELFATRVERRGAEAVIEVWGELDGYTVGAFDRAVDDVLAEPAERLVVNAGALGFIDSEGLRAMVRAARRVCDGGFTFRSPSPHIRRLVDMSGLGGILGVEA